MEHEIQYRAHNSRLLVPVLSQINPIHKPLLYFLKISFNIILPSTPRFSKCLSYLRFSDQKFVWVYLRSQGCYMSRPSQTCIFIVIIIIIIIIIITIFKHAAIYNIVKLLLKQFSPPSCHFLPLRAKYFHQHPVLKHPQSMFLPQHKTELHSNK